ncbi:hypothetical protein ACNPQK_11270 [Acinetobacter guillouiae]|jgi:hypothetical protein|nr:MULTISPECIES: hypothetical protein [Acinetobacter]ENU56972.1 hypothetical protein F981_04107 [Acinetobacter guillouiae CIP 63.46]EPH32728.1 hypothetical protein L291_3105 [Acinetobacter guillouiae MSP4-18]MCS4299536.1 hypothetical protein [Acinetobacter guillouiae]MCW2252883.1 hypothetical protein [Acinetobacter sp. BIGb0204]NII36349.1 hypothetical protein [Acinetobacter sp. BIGb0196]
MNQIKTAVKKTHPLKAFFIDLFSVRAGVYIKQNTSVNKVKG